jgi:hypothetical protein
VSCIWVYEKGKDCALTYDLRSRDKLKEFLASFGIICLSLGSIESDVGFAKSFPAYFLLRMMPF